MNKFLVLVSFLVSANSFAIGHYDKIPNTMIQYKDIYGVYQGRSVDEGTRFNFQFRFKKIEGTTGLVYYRDSLGHWCAGRYSVVPGGTVIPAVFLKPSNMTCRRNGNVIRMNVGFIMPAMFSMDNKKYTKKDTEAVVVINSKDSFIVKMRKIIPSSF